MLGVKEKGEEGGRGVARCHRCLPFVCTALADGAPARPPPPAADPETEPAPALAPELNRGFLDAAAPSAEGARGPSFVIILAWISSSFAALTFFGQKSVTNLPRTSVNR